MVLPLLCRASLVCKLTAAIVCVPAAISCGWDNEFTNEHCWDVEDNDAQFQVPLTVLSVVALID